MKALGWMAQPIEVDWVKRLVLSRGSLWPRFQMRSRDRERVRQLQFERAADLVAAMGLRTELSANQAARVVEVLGPYVPGLTVRSPVEDVAVPGSYSLTWAKPETGRPSEWSRERLLALANDVDVLRAAGRAESDRGAMRLLVNEAKARGRTVPSSKTLANRLVEARALQA